MRVPIHLIISRHRSRSPSSLLTCITWPPVQLQAETATNLLAPGLLPRANDNPQPPRHYTTQRDNRPHPDPCALQETAQTGCSPMNEHASSPARSTCLLSLWSWSGSLATNACSDARLRWGARQGRITACDMAIWPSATAHRCDREALRTGEALPHDQRRACKDGEGEGADCDVPVCLPARLEALHVRCREDAQHLGCAQGRTLR